MTDAVKNFSRFCCKPATRSRKRGLQNAHHHHVVSLSGISADLDPSIVGAGADMTQNDETHEGHGSTKKRHHNRHGNYSTFEWDQKLKAPSRQLEYMRDRTTVDDELEDKMNLRPFLQIPLFAGQGNRRTVGYWKGLIKVSKQPSPCDADIDASSELSILKEIRTPKKLELRLYILTGTKLTSRDNDGLADPYLVIKIGKERRSTRNDYLPDTLEPGFYYSVQIPVTMPGKLSNDVF